MVSRTHRLGVVVVALAVLAGPVRADLPLARLDRIVPSGGEAGSSVEVNISGKDLDDVKVLDFDHPGFKAEWLKPDRFRITIGDNVPDGTHECAVGRFGVSNAELFAVSRGLTEVFETEPNDTREQAQAVPLNAAVNGECEFNGDDVFRFPAKKGERVTIDCQAVRLDSQLRASLVLSSADGKVLAQGRPYYERVDPMIDFVAPADGSYILGLHDANFRGGLQYRLIVSNRPQIEGAFPLMGTPGETEELTILGRNLPGGRPMPEWVEQGLPLDQVTMPFTMPKDAPALQRFDFINHPAGQSENIRGLQVWPRGLENALDPVTLLFAEAPVTREREPNDRVETGQEVALPTVINGRFDKRNDRDWYSFRAKAGEVVAFELWGERVGLPGDAIVIVMDDKGNDLTSFDDNSLPFNCGALNLVNRDPLGLFTAPRDGTYRVLVQERSHNGGARFPYALRLGKPTPDFDPFTYQDTLFDPSFPLVGQGGSSSCKLILRRWDGYTGPVTIEAEGLPPGLTCPPIYVGSQVSVANLVFTAARDAAEWTGAVRLKASASIGDRRVEHDVRCVSKRWAGANPNLFRLNRLFRVAVRGPAPYGLKLPSEPATVAAGGRLEFRVTLARFWPDFKGPVKLIGFDLPPGIGFDALEIPADKSEVTGRLAVAATVAPGTYSVVLRGDAEVPFDRDPKAVSKPNVRVADPSTPLTLVVTAPPKK